MKNLRFVLTTLLVLTMLDFSNAQDWANLKRYQKENAMLVESDAKQPRIVFMGNSITEGWIGMRPEFFSDKPYINRGIGGQTTPQMLLRFRQDVMDLNATVVVILAGINDIAGNTGPSSIEMIQDNMASMAQLAKANKIKVVLCSVLPAFDFPWRPGLEPSEKVVALNAWLKAYAENEGHVYVDYFTPMADSRPGLKKELGDDGVHPNALGYAIMEPLVESAIEKALKKTKKRKD
ncbi:MAG: SGNH/GDSL hydrolase family protein [Reichenbachiella sp.]|uniref:SGNH/GDSL hydrolase family protein n=1 Tax=Reichenbachiella sp. TaxID=2184521 RepID=UPI0032663A47